MACIFQFVIFHCPSIIMYHYEVNIDCKSLILHHKGSMSVIVQPELENNLFSGGCQQLSPGNDGILEVLLNL